MLIIENALQAPRRNPEIMDGIRTLEDRLVLAGGDEPRAWAEMTTAEADFVADQLYLCTLPSVKHGIKGLMHWLCNYFFIKDKKAGFHVLYPFWDSQLMLLDVIDAKWKSEQAIWLMILKARQLGISTLVEGIVLYLTIFNKNWSSLLLADEPSQTEYIFEMARNGLENLPWWMRPERRYNVKGHHMIFDRENEVDRIQNPGLKSQLIAESANQRSGAGYGKTFLALHASEVPKYKDATVLTKGILPTVPETHPAVFAILEGAAEKRHDHFHRLWRAGEQGLTKFETLFIPWYGESQYFLPPTEGWTPSTETQATVKAINESYGVTLEDGQAFWYENKRNNYLAFEEEDATFLSQFPSNPHEAFQNSGRCAFSKRKLHNMMLHFGRPPRWQGEIWLADDNRTWRISHLNDPKDQPHKWRGRLKIWQWPWQRRDAGATFYVAGDPSGGTSTGHPASWQVFLVPVDPFEPIQQVACWTGKAGPSQFARIGAALGYLFLGAEVAPEVNNMGQTVVSDLKNVIRYPFLYRWKREDKATRVLSDFFGWQTTRQSKKALISRMAEGISEDTVILRDIDTIDEAYDFITDDGLEYYAVTLEGHGDRMMAAMIGYYCVYQTRQFKPRSDVRDQHLQEKFDKNRDYANTDYSAEHDKTSTEGFSKEFQCL